SPTVARYGRIRTRRPLDPVPRSPHPKQARTDRRSRRLGTTPQPTSRQGRLAIHNRPRPRQAVWSLRESKEQKFPTANTRTAKDLFLYAPYRYLFGQRTPTSSEGQPC